MGCSSTSSNNKPYFGRKYYYGNRADNQEEYSQNTSNKSSKWSSGATGKNAFGPESFHLRSTRIHNRTSVNKCSSIANNKFVTNFVEIIIATLYKLKFT